MFGQKLVQIQSSNLYHFVMARVKSDPKKSLLKNVCRFVLMRAILRFMSKLPSNRGTKLRSTCLWSWIRSTFRYQILYRRRSVSDSAALIRSWIELELLFVHIISCLWRIVWALFSIIFCLDWTKIIRSKTATNMTKKNCRLYFVFK